MKEEKLRGIPLMLKACLCLGGAAALLALNYLLFQLYIARYLSLQTVWTAARDIPPRTRITEADLIEIRMPEGYVPDHICTEKKEIIGRYTEIQGMIPAGSPFYRSMLFREEDLPDRAAVQLREGQTSFVMNTDVSRLGSITAGMRADIYVTIGRRGENPLSGCLFRNVRVLSVRDHKGLDLRDAESTGIPYMIETAVSSADIPLLTLAESAGEIRMFPTSSSYDTDAEAELVPDSEVTLYLQTLSGRQPE
jgi:Flp pilus assembly protein CpaB